MVYSVIIIVLCDSFIRIYNSFNLELYWFADSGISVKCAPKESQILIILFEKFSIPIPGKTIIKATFQTFLTSPFP